MAIKCYAQIRWRARVLNVELLRRRIPIVVDFGRGVIGELPAVIALYQTIIPEFTNIPQSLFLNSARISNHKISHYLKLFAHGCRILYSPKAWRSETMVRLQCWGNCPTWRNGSPRARNGDPCTPYFFLIFFATIPLGVISDLAPLPGGPSTWASRDYRRDWFGWQRRLRLLTSLFLLCVACNAVCPFEKISKLSEINSYHSLSSS